MFLISFGLYVERYLNRVWTLNMRPVYIKYNYIKYCLQSLRTVCNRQALMNSCIHVLRVDTYGTCFKANK